MNQFELNAEPRTDVGKGASRRLRHSGKLPGIVYGAGKESTAITLDHDDIIHHIEHEAFYSHVLTLILGKEKQKVVLKDMQRHPFKPRILHIDLQRVSETEKLTMRVPIHFLNEEKCIGVKQGGGVVSHLMTELEISCLPKDLPEYIEVDMLNINVGDTIHLGDLKLPDGVEAYSLTHGGYASAPVASVHIPKVIEEEEIVAEEELEAVAVPVAGEETVEAQDTDKADKDDKKDKRDKKDREDD